MQIPGQHPISSEQKTPGYGPGVHRNILSRLCCLLRSIPPIQPQGEGAPGLTSQGRVGDRSQPCFATTSPTPLWWLREAQPLTGTIFPTEEHDSPSWNGGNLPLVSASPPPTKPGSAQPPRLLQDFSPDHSDTHRGNAACARATRRQCRGRSLPAAPRGSETTPARGAGRSPG